MSRPWVSKEWSSLRVERAPSPWAGHQDGFGHECHMGLDGELMAVPGHCSEACLFCGEMGGLQHHQDGASSNACPRGLHRARIHQAHLGRC